MELAQAGSDIIGHTLTLSQVVPVVPNLLKTQRLSV